MSDSAILGIDVGTTRVKAFLFDLENGRRYFSYRNCNLILSKSGYVEQDPRQILAETKNVIRDVMKLAADRVNVISLSFSSQGGTLIPLDEHGKPVCNAITWMDRRAHRENSILKERFGEDFFYLKTGWRLLGCLPLLQIYWLKKNKPDLFKKIRKFAFVGDYIAYEFSGEWVIDPPSAAITMLYNIRDGVWDEELLEIVDISEDQLPKIRDSGEKIGFVSQQVRKELNLHGDEIIVSNGGHDQYCASLGAGCLNEGDLLLSGGTAWVLLLTSSRLIFDTRTYISPGRHVIRNKWGLLSSISAAGAGVNWLKDLLSHLSGEEFTEKRFFEILEEEAREIPPGCEGIFFTPHFTGSGAPFWEKSLRASILGLSLHHKAAHIFRALMEGIGFEVLLNMECFERLGVKIKSVNMIGGASRSRIWPQILSNIINHTISIPMIREAACVGAAILAGRGGGVFKSYEEGVKNLITEISHVHPVEAESKKYQEIFHSYQKLYEKLREIYVKVTESP
ncbi:hypothetical protein J7L00_03785 [Candidatus Bathyarchaeota archaeon]|nr:hypothetical protein [Candidatus Bathyarchaeota archaeon]